jgi:phosphatidylglycerophosphate synthase
MSAAFKEATRVSTGLLTAIERRCLLWIAARIPPSINADHLTSLAGIAMLAAGFCYGLARQHRAALLAVPLLLAVNWFGDSLDGTIARVRQQPRPRYGFYVDHVLDTFGILFLFAGLAWSGYMTPVVAAAFLIAYYLLSIELFLATYCLGTFQMSFWKLGPTELRIVLALGTLALLWHPMVRIAGTDVLLFDAGGIVATTGLLVTAIVSFARNGRALYRAEPIPAFVKASAGKPEVVMTSAGKSDLAKANASASTAATAGAMS